MNILLLGILHTDMYAENAMEINEEGLALLKKSEACRLTSYQDKGGIWTIGWGSTGSDIHYGLTWTQEQCDDRLKHDLLAFEDGINDHLKVTLTSNQFSALVVFTYNVGLGALYTSHLFKFINESNFTTAAEQFGRWNMVHGIVDKGLIQRRAAERDLFLKA